MDPKLNLLAADLDALCDKHKDVLRGDNNVESLCYAIADIVQADCDRQKDPQIVGILQDVVESLRHAGFCYYASFK